MNTTGGLCECGCGSPAPIAKRNDRKDGYVKGEPVRFIAGHQLRLGINITHGESRKGNWSAEYRTWSGMIQRCTDPKSEAFKYYGARGIAVCDRWDRKKGGSYENFLADMGRKPTPKHTIERKENNLGYTPDNCKWATWSEQNINRRFAVMMTIGDETRTLSDWAAKFGMDRSTLFWRICRANGVTSLRAKEILE